MAFDTDELPIDQWFYCRRCCEWQLRYDFFEHLTRVHDINPETGRPWSEFQEELRTAIVAQDVYVPPRP